jgi:steroid delta-isomerase-like uncharacterized protein
MNTFARRYFMRITKSRIIVTAAVCATVLVASSSAWANDHSEGIARRWIDVWNSHDADEVVALFTHDAIYEDVSFGVVTHGSEELRAFAQGFFDMVPDLRLDLVGSSVSEGHGYIEWVLSGTDVGVFRTGRTFRVRGATVLDVRGNRISRNLDYYDLATILRQIGLLT